MGNMVNVVLLNVASVVQIHLFQLSCGGQVKKPPFGKYQRRTPVMVM
jgi:hypothetical protein